MPQKIVSNGCAYTEQRYLNNKDRWTTKIGVADNLAFGGASNERIFYTTIEYLNQYDPDTVIINWTTMNRHMLPSSDGSRLAICAPGIYIDELVERPKEHWLELGDLYYKHCDSNYTSLERMLNYILHIQKVCNDRKIKLLNFTSYLHPLTDEYLYQVSKDIVSINNTEKVHNNVQESVDKLKTLLNLIDKDVWIHKFWYSMGEHCRDFPRTNTGHPGVDGSNHWASLISDYL